MQCSWAKKVWSGEMYVHNPCYGSRGEGDIDMYRTCLYTVPAETYSSMAKLSFPSNLGQYQPQLTERFIKRRSSLMVEIHLHNIIFTWHYCLCGYEKRKYDIHFAYSFNMSPLTIRHRNRCGLLHVTLRRTTFLAGLQHQFVGQFFTVNLTSLRKFRVGIFCKNASF